MDNSIWNFAFIFGLVFVVAGILMLLHQITLKSRCTEKADGLIMEGDIWNKEAALMLTFTAKGRYYRLPFPHSNRMSAGMSVTVIYNPDKISSYSCYILEDAPNSIKMGLICIGGGIIAMLIGYGVSMGLFPEIWLF